MRIQVKELRKEERRENNKHTINTTLDPDVSMLITSGSITSVEDTRVRLRKTHRTTKSGSSFILRDAGEVSVRE